MKALYYGDNLQVLHDSIATESVDLIYLDPRFNSKATYNVGCQGQSRHLAAWALISAYSHDRNLACSPKFLDCRVRSRFCLIIAVETSRI